MYMPPKPSAGTAKLIPLNMTNYIMIYIINMFTDYFVTVIMPTVILVHTL